MLGETIKAPPAETQDFIYNGNLWSYPPLQYAWPIEPNNKLSTFHTDPQWSFNRDDTSHIKLRILCVLLVCSSGDNAYGVPLFVILISRSCLSRSFRKCCSEKLNGRDVVTRITFSSVARLCIDTAAWLLNVIQRREAAGNNKWKEGENTMRKEV